MRVTNGRYGELVSQTHTHTGLLILQPDGWIEQRGIYKKIR